MTRAPTDLGAVRVVGELRGGGLVVERFWGDTLREKFALCPGQSYDHDGTRVSYDVLRGLERGRIVTHAALLTLAGLT